jgi:hypothetical protein
MQETGPAAIVKANGWNALSGGPHFRQLEPAGALVP